MSMLEKNKNVVKVIYKRPANDIYFPHLNEHPENPIMLAKISIVLKLRNTLRIR